MTTTPLHPDSRLIQGTDASVTAYALAQRYQELAPPLLLVICPNTERREQMARDLSFFLQPSPVITYVARPLHAAQKLLLQEDFSASRCQVLQQLQNGFSGVVVTTLPALLQRTVPVALWQEQSMHLQVGQNYDHSQLAEKLTHLGYSREAMVRQPGEFAKRGGIIDCYPTGAEQPLRLEFLGDTLESIRAFNAATQLSFKITTPIREFRITPQNEIILTTAILRNVLPQLKAHCDQLDIPKSMRAPVEEALQQGETSHLFEDLLPLFYHSLYPPTLLLDHLNTAPGKLAVAWVHRHAMQLNHEQFAAELRQQLDELRQQRGSFFTPQLYAELDELQPRLASMPQLFLEDIGDDPAIKTISYAPESLPKEARFMTEKLRGYAQLGFQIHIACHNTTQSDRLRKVFLHNDEASSRLSGFHFKVGDLEQGFILPAEKLICIADREIFSQQSKRQHLSTTQQWQRLHDPDAETLLLNQFSNGCYVVHIEHGVARYAGLKHLQLQGHAADFVMLEYHGGDKLYLPTYRMNLIQPYSFAGQDNDDITVELDQLGAGQWTAKKEKAKRDIEAMAQELLKLYAMRKIVGGHAFNGRDREYNEFEAAFVYTETRDQQRAIDDVLLDMQAPRPMDRLICGDVGFGKTEVAMRAAYRAILDGKQVAVLVPTTLLAQQHATTFQERLGGFGVKINSLSRFKSPAEQKTIIADLAAGKLDIIVGTHRLLAAEIIYKDLGLLIIDEEHRFGVAHKDRIKQYRAKIDVIAMTATPIPRTLQLSLYGFRDLSVIETAPLNRQPIQTYVARFDDQLIRNVILKEMARQGQIFFVHNRVHTMDAMEKYLSRTVPEARLGVVHGSMSETRMEAVMQKFVDRQIDVLLATTIIESGLDFPNANTILINRADRLGLAQLYQLRGRVGRSDREAAAYLLIPGDELISETAEKRLRAMKHNAELGSGWRLAMRDLEIRGAGNLLGTKQSGHIRSIGMELYSQMLENTVRRLQGEVVEESIEPELQLGVNAYFPTDYIQEEPIRVVLYRRLADCNDDTGLQQMSAELADRFGPPPPPVTNLIAIVAIKLVARRLRLKRLHLTDSALILNFDRSTQVEAAKLVAFLANPKERAQMLDAHTLSISTSENNRSFSLESVKNLLLMLI